MALDAYKASLNFAPLPARTILTQPRKGTPWLARTCALNVAATKKLEQTWIAKITMKTRDGC